MTSFWQDYPQGRALIDASLWSADCLRYGEEIRRVDPYVDMYHIDVSDGRFVPGLLFFPDLLAGLRPATARKFHVHMMTENPLAYIDDFASAGAGLISVHAENGPLVFPALSKIRAHGLGAGLVLGLGLPVETVIPYLDQIHFVVLMGTAMGIKGVSPSPLACERIRAMRALLRERGCEGRVKIEADGGLRTHTVPDMRAAGADIFSPGSLVFKSEDLAATAAWFAGLKQE